MNPSAYFTFQDSHGKILKKVRYETYIVSYGIKPELAIRLQIGILKGPLQATFDNIPDKFRISVSFSFKRLVFKYPLLSIFFSYILLFNKYFNFLLVFLKNEREVGILLFMQETLVG